MQEPQRVNILGVGVSAVNMAMALEAIEGWIAHREPNYICVTPAHSVMDCVNNPMLYPLFNQSGMTVPDGMAIVWLLKLHGQAHVGRVCGPDLMDAVMAVSLEKGWRHFFYGGHPGVPERLAERFSSRYPGLQIAGWYSPPFRDLTPEEDEQVVAQIRAARPHIVWVGISSPRQERWMAEHLERLNVPVLIGVGAAFDFWAGTKRRAPRWMQRAGLEWLFRFLSEPKRLWPRYRQYPRFVWLALRQLAQQKLVLPHVR